MGKCLIIAILLLSGCERKTDDTEWKLYGIAGASYLRGCREAGGVDCDQKSALFVETLRKKVTEEKTT